MRASKIRRLIATLVLLGAAGTLTACGGPSDAAESAPARAELPAPPATPGPDPVLTVAGAITEHNVGDTLVFDLAALGEFDEVSGEVFEPWTETDLGFVGVRFADVLDVAGVAPDATIEVVALDDYTVRLDRQDIDDSVVLATGDAEGAEFGVAVGGPTRLVFLDEELPVADPDNWIWSIETVTAS